MFKTDAKTPESYLASLEPSAAGTLKKLRALVRKNLPKGIVENMRWGMITYEVPLETYPDTYNGQPMMFAAIAAQKNHLALYLINAYSDPALAKLLRDGFASAGKKLDMGKSCLRFTKLDDLALDVIADVIAALPLETFLERCELARSSAKTARETRSAADSPKAKKPVRRGTTRTKR